MFYKAYLEQENTNKLLECNKYCIDIEASSYEEAALILKKLIRKKYSLSFYKLRKCELFEISNTLTIDLDLIYNELEKEKTEYLLNKKIEEKYKKYEKVCN
jgi:hypothetical protein